MAEEKCHFMPQLKLLCCQQHLSSHGLENRLVSEVLGHSNHSQIYSVAGKRLLGSLSSSVYVNSQQRSAAVSVSVMAQRQQTKYFPSPT